MTTAPTLGLGEHEYNPFTFYHKYLALQEKTKKYKPAYFTRFGNVDDVLHQNKTKGLNMRFSQNTNCKFEHSDKPFFLLDLDGIFPCKQNFETYVSSQ